MSPDMVSAPPLGTEGLFSSGPGWCRKWERLELCGVDAEGPEWRGRDWAAAQRELWLWGAVAPGLGHCLGIAWSGDAA